MPVSFGGSALRSSLSVVVVTFALAGSIGGAAAQYYPPPPPGYPPPYAQPGYAAPPLPARRHLRSAQRRLRRSGRRPLRAISAATGRPRLSRFVRWIAAAAGSDLRRLPAAAGR